MSASFKRRSKAKKRRSGVTTLIGGSTSGQAITIAAAPILSRLYSPSEFGIFAIVFGVSLVIASVATLRLELAIVLPADDRDAFSVAWLAISCLMITILTTAAAILFFGTSIAETLGRPDMTPHLFAIPGLAGLVGVYTVLNQLAIRRQLYRAIAIRNFLQQSTAAAAQVCAGIAQMGVKGLLLGSVSGQVLGILTLLRASGLATETARGSLVLDRMRRQLIRYRRFPAYLAPAALLNNLGQQAPLLLIGIFYGATAAGWMGLTQRVLAIPAGIIGLAIAQVYLGSLSRLANTSLYGAHALFWRTSRNLAVLGIVGAMLLGIGAPWAFSTLFGAEWETSGRVAQVMAPYFAAQMLASPISQTLIVFERVRLQLSWDVMRLVAVVAPITLCWLTEQSAITCVLAFSLCGTFAYILLWVFCWRTLKTARSISRAGEHA